MTETNSLLRDYAKDGSETAFRQLVTQYVDLVYSTAVRRVFGDAHAAEDVVQTVFTDLARKAGSLPENVMLGGWLHKHTCFVASNFRRSESRRVAREKEAAAMESGSEANWTEIAPALDQAIEELSDEDRDAIVLRFFERRDFRAIGEAIGASENAAQKRVARALEKLRGLLAQRGVALSAAALLGGLTDQSIVAAPSSLANKASDSALANSGAKAAAVAAGVSAWVVALWVAAAVVGIGVFALVKAGSKGIASDNQVEAVSTAANSPAAVVQEGQPSRAGRSAPIGKDASVKPPMSGLTLKLKIVAADSGQVIPNVPLSYQATDAGKIVQHNLHADRAGICAAPFTTNTTELEIITRVEGFADTRAQWKFKHGDKIPEEYTMRLKRGTEIGGKVVNGRGELVPGAVVHLNLMVAEDLDLRTDSNEFGWMDLVAEDGTWKTTRILKNYLGRVIISATHPEYAEGQGYQLTINDGVTKALAGEYVSKLEDIAVVSGIVVNEEDQPVADAKVLVGPLHMTGSKETKTKADGRFTVAGGPVGKTLLSASAKGYAVTTIRIHNPTNEVHKLVLKQGRVLKARVVDPQGQPVSKAHFWLATLDPDPDAALFPQVEFSADADVDGRLVWNQAPMEKLRFDIQANGFMRKGDVWIEADGIEHTITLNRGLKISGTVTDGATGLPMPKFRLIAGWPESNTMPGETKPRMHWSPIERHWLTFKDGKFETTFEEPIVSGTKENLYAFKIEAEGYASATTRVVREEEGAATFAISLRPQSTKLTVLAPNGQPAADAEVVLGHSRGFVQLSGTSVMRNPNVIVRDADDEGQVKWEGDLEGRVVAVSPAGFAMVAGSELDGNAPTIRLQPWGRVEGRLTRRGKPVPEWQLTLRSKMTPDHFSLSIAEPVTPDPDGRFAFAFAPPGEFTLTRNAPIGEQNFPMPMPVTRVTVKAGETTTVDYDSRGVTLSMRAVWPSDHPRTPEHKIFCNAATKGPRPSPELQKNPEALAQWGNSPEMIAFRERMRHYQFRETSPGVWSCDDVEPGEYFVGIGVLEKQPEPGGPSFPKWIAQREIVVSDNSTEEKIDLGQFVLTNAEQPPGAARP